MRDNFSTKDLSFINDMFSWNHNIIKTIELIEQNITDEELKSLVSSIKNKHIKTCQSINEVIK